MASDLKQRILQSIQVTTLECWEWKFRKHAHGYGMTKVNGKKQKAHRASWQAFNGSIPDKLYVLHKCDNKVCVNPDHLFLGTHQDNMTDLKRKGKAKGRGPIKLTHKERVLISELNMSHIEIARCFGITASYIPLIKKRLKASGHI